MRKFLPAGCVLAPMMIVAATAAASVIVENADLLYIEGPGQVAVVTGTVVYSMQDDAAGTWKALLTRQQGHTSIEVTAASGQYQAQIWSVPASPSNPMRTHSTTVIDFGGDTGPELVDSVHLVALLEEWGSCSGSCPWDLNDDGVVDAHDLLILLDAWGQPVPW
jgi:hypothetical protein